MRTLITLVAIVILGAILIPQFVFTVDETQHIVVTRFGEVQRSLSSPGLQFKTPFIETVNRFDKRLLRIDVPAASMPDQENQFLEIDAYVRYRILDPVKFFRRLRDELNAEGLLGNIVISRIREEVAQSSRSDIIGATLLAEIPDPVTGVVIRIVEPKNTRAEMMRRVQIASDQAVKSAENDFGIEIVDVRIKAADFPGATEESVFARMRTEREVQAKRLRAEGEEESLKIRADVDRRRTIILAEAERDANVLRGEGEGEAIQIFAEALEQDPEFFAFRRSLEAYAKFLTENTTVVLSADADLFQYVESPALPASNP
ncbi:MAG: protease modulator HflC [Dehalococcoidia bacterium]